MINWFPDPYPGELFYSICARFQASMQYPHDRTVVRVLFGNEQASATIDFPCRLVFFVDHLPYGRQYTVDSLIEKHTLFPYYQPFLPVERVQQIRQQMRDGPVTGIKLRLGIVHRTVKYPSFLRYCPACVAEERVTRGECYWHRLHQAPGVMVCPRHEVLLEESRILTTPAFHTQTFFAAEDSIPTIAQRNARASQFFQTYLRLALTIAELLDASFPSQEQEFWEAQYTALMSQHRYVTPKGFFHSTEFLQAFLQCYPLELLHQLGWDFAMTSYYQSHWWSAMRGMRRSVPPLFHLMTLDMLGVGIASFFLKRYTSPAVFGNGPWPCLNPVCRHYRQPVISSCQITRDGHSRNLVGRFACPCGFIYSRLGPEQGPDDRYQLRRIIAFGEAWDNQLRAWWNNPAISLSEISRRLEVRRDIIVRQARRLGLLLARPSQGKSASQSGVTPPRPGKDADWYRRQWRVLLKAHPEATRTELQQLLCAAYIWLQRHDKIWLNQHLPPKLPKRARRSPSALDTTPSVQAPLHQDPDDAELATAVRVTAQQFLASSELPKRISQRRLQLANPALKVLYHRKKQFPLTSQAVEVCLETQENFGLRRVRWALQCYSEERVCPSRSQFVVRAGIYAMRTLPVIRQAVDEALFMLELLKGHNAALAAV